MREVLATEMLEALGVNTSKSFALFETGEALERGDEPSPTRSAVLTRLSHGHIRIGTFQRLAFFGEAENIAKLDPLLPRTPLRRAAGSDDDAENALRLFDLVSQATATLAASYLAAGFVHGVLNSDNINITGESFDYGPWRFTPEWDPDFTAAYFDHSGLYAFGRQPEAIHWDLAQLAGCLSLVAEAPPLSELLGGWSERFEEALVDAMLRRLGVDPPATMRPGAGRGADRRARRLARRPSTASSSTGAAAAIPAPSSIRPSRSARSRRRSKAANARQTHPYWSDAAPCSMHIDEVEAIWSAIATSDDWQPFDDKVAAVRRMGEAMSADAPPA